MNPICVRGLPGSESRLWRIALQALVSMPEDAEWEDTSITKKYTGGWGARTLGSKGQGVGMFLVKHQGCGLHNMHYAYIYQLFYVPYSHLGPQTRHCTCSAPPSLLYRFFSLRSQDGRSRKEASH